MPVAAVKIGRMWPNNPESWVELVELSVMNRSSACAEPAARTEGNTTDQANHLSTGAPSRQPIQANLGKSTVVYNLSFHVAQELTN
jgi:hypothetical protein